MAFATSPLTCSQLCTYGAVPSCGWSGSGPAEAFCFFPQEIEGGHGDLAACVELCSCDDPCSHPGAICYAWESLAPADPALVAATGHPGVCAPPDIVGKGIELPCGAGGAGGAGGGG